MRVAVFVCLISLILTASILDQAVAEPQAHHTFRYSRPCGNSVAFSPDSTQMAVSVDGNVVFIDVQSGREVAKVKGTPHTIGYSADGKRLYTVSQSSSRLIDLSTGTQLRPRSIAEPGFIGFVLDRVNGKLIIKSMHQHGPVAAIGKVGIGDELIAISQDRSGPMLNVVGQSVAQTYAQLKGDAGTFVRLKILPKGLFQEQDAATYTVRRLHRQQRKDGSFIYFNRNASTSENLVPCSVARQIQLRTTSTGRTVARIQSIDLERNRQVAVSSDGSLFAIVARQKLEPSIPAVELFDVATQERIALMPIAKDSFFDLEFTPDNKFLLVATHDSVEVADVRMGRFVSLLDLGWQPPNPIPDEPEIENNISSISGAVSREIAAGARRNNAARPTHNLAKMIAVSPKGLVATADQRGRVRIWDLTGFPVKDMPENPHEIPHALSFSPNGNWLAYYVAGVLHLVDVSDVAPISAEDALAKLAKLTESRPDDVVLQKRTWLALTRAGKSEQAVDLLNKIDEARLGRRERFVQSIWDSRSELDNIAWRFALGAHPKTLELAKRAAERGFELDADGDDADIADTLARIHHELGDTEKAIAFQQQAVARSSVKEYSRRLENYQAEMTSQFGTPP